jgi:ribonuclease R
VPSDEDNALEARLLAAVERRSGPVTAADLLRTGRFDRSERTRAKTLLAGLEERGLLVRSKGDRLTLPARLDLMPGRLHANPAGFAFVIPDDPEREDVYVPASAVRPAMHGDRVLVRIERQRRRERVQGQVVKVLVRSTTRVVGVLRRGKTTAVVVPQEQRITVPILVPKGAEGGAADGDMVVAELVSHPGLTSEAEARVTTVLGPASDPRVEIEAVIHQYDLPQEFPPEVRAAARRIPKTVPATAAEGRLDLRDLPIVTIDGENARDFDDAILVEVHGTGYRLTVAVADVAHYVRTGDAIDQEARARGTSVYFPDRVLPMLPEELSNGICSLRPNEDRLAKAVRMDFDGHGRLTHATFHEAIIRSAARLTYTQVRQALEDKDPQVRAALGAVLEPVERAETLAHLLIARRAKRGAIDFDLPEAEVLLNSEGRPEQIVRAERSIANRLIEEFMLSANEAVARELARRKLPSLHRVHEPPAPDKLSELARFLEGFGLRLKLDHGKAEPAAFAAVLKQVEGRPEEKLVNLIVLRAMQQARYAAEPLGHFGLATDAYTHFTSPIRRYPDLIVHRILEAALRGERGMPQDLPAIAEESSRRERVAMEAERDVVQLKKIQYMQDKVGQIYDGFVSGVTAFGMFVELADVFVEGLVHISTFGDDYYEHLERQHALRGRRTRRMFRVGDPVRVEVVGVSIERRHIDFRVAGMEPRGAEERKGDKWRKRRRS